MSKILFYTDVHLSRTSSIVRSIGKNFSTRLENIIASVSWAEELSKEHDCKEVICLGDFFDKPELNAEEITALSEIKWNEKVLHHFVVGNHEADTASLRYNSAQAVNLKYVSIEDEPYRYSFDDKLDIYFLPYITEDNRKELSYYLTDYNPNKKHIICSHNDIKGIRMGMFESKAGFKIDEIEKSCDLFLNGHLHNGTKFCKNGYNLGNLTGQNFGENAKLYKHGCFILDTDTFELTFYENPYAFNFYNLELKEAKLPELKDNAVLSVKCDESINSEVRELIDTNKKIIASRVILSKPIVDVENSSSISINEVNHLDQFKEFCIEVLGNTDTVISEIQEVIG